MSENDNNKRRQFRAKMNIIVSLLKQFVGLIYGVLVPQLMISTFGSEAYGATASITQFLTYVTLLEGGIGGVARASLYKPLADMDKDTVSAIVYEIKKFFRIIAVVFIFYVLVLACGFKFISHIKCFDWFTTFLLVLVISISTFAQYFIGISYTVLLEAAQLSFITDAINIFAVILNTILIILFINIGLDLVLVKLASSCVFVLRPLLMWLYVKKKFKLKTVKTDKEYLQQKWDGLAQHIAYFLHTNTDIAVLTIFGNLKIVAIYSVYNMIVSQVQNVVTSFSTGMEALFGDMLARNEINELRKSFDFYDTFISYVTVILFSITMTMIVPFVKIYTSGIKDANYVQPVFAVILIMASIIACLRTPYHNLTIAAGHFKQTQVAAYGEAICNILISILLVLKLGLIGVAIGTLVATGFRMIYYALYLSKNIFNRDTTKFVKREFVNILSIVLICLIGFYIQSNLNPLNYLDWIFCSIIVSFVAVVFASALNYVFYKDLFLLTIKKLFRKA